MRQLQYGVYNDNCAGMSPAEVNAHYGFDEDKNLLNGAMYILILETQLIKSKGNEAYDDDNMDTEKKESQDEESDEEDSESDEEESDEEESDEEESKDEESEDDVMSSVTIRREEFNMEQVTFCHTLDSL